MMKKLSLLFAFFAAVILLMSSCQKRKVTYRIGISQCAGGAWRDMQNDEMLIESTFYDGVELEFRDASDLDSIQIQDIQYFLDKKVDMLIVSPNTIEALTPIIEKVYDAGIPVVLFDRRISSSKYTAYVGANNYNIGRQVGQYLAGLLNEKGAVIEIVNNMRSAPFRDRHEGFKSAMAEYPDLKLLSIPTRVTDEKTEEMVDSLIEQGQPMDAIFMHIDRTDVPIQKALASHQKEDEVITVAIDGMPFENCGIDRVLEGLQTATFVYPTGGDFVMRVAMDILQNRPYNRDNELTTYVIDQRNVRSVRAQQDIFMEQNQKIRRLHKQSDWYMTQLSQGKFYLYLSILVALLLGVILFVVYRAYWMRNRMNQLLVKKNDLIIQQKNKMQSQRDQLVEITKQLEEATQAKLTFFTNLSHDFRTPLTLISGPLAQLKEHSHWESEEFHLYEIIQKNIAVLLRLVNQIIDFRKLENHKMTVQLSHCDLGALMTDWSVGFYALAQERNVRFLLKVDPAFAYELNIDMPKTERIFYNLVYNAFKFTPQEGEILVDMTQVTEENQPMLQFSVSDTGIGMTQENIERIFQRFYKVDTHDSGYGIGLNLVKALVELQGGHISVKSEVGKGSCFTITLPMNLSDGNVGDNMVQAKAEEQTSRTMNHEPQLQESALLAEHLKLSAEKPRETIHPETKGNFTSTSTDGPSQEVETGDEATASDSYKLVVLVVDDNADIRDYIAYILKSDYQVLQAENGKQGLELAEKFIPNVIISDVMMPVMDGFELCTQVKQNMTICHIPFILLTACTLDEQRVSGYVSGADSYIEKPFTAEILKSRVANLIQNRQLIKPMFVHAPIVSVPEEAKDLDVIFLRRFRDLVEEGLGDSGLSMDLLGEKMGMSRVQLYRKVKALSGMSPSDVIKEARMTKAQALLKLKNSNVVDVAYNVGFTSAAYFTKCYKEFFGKLPTEEE